MSNARPNATLNFRAFAGNTVACIDEDACAYPDHAPRCAGTHWK
jgi:hypothetical protein